MASEEQPVILSEPSTTSVGGFSFVVDSEDMHGEMYSTQESPAISCLVEVPEIYSLFDFYILKDTGRCFLTGYSPRTLAPVEILRGHTIICGAENELYIHPDDRVEVNIVEEDGDGYDSEIIYSYEIMPEEILIGTDKYLAVQPCKPMTEYSHTSFHLEWRPILKQLTLMIEDLPLVIVDLSGPVLKLYPNWAVVAIQDIHDAVIENCPRTWFHRSFNSPHTPEEIREY